MANVSDIQINGNDTKLYTNLNYAGIEFTSQTINASEMTNFTMDIWTPNPTSVPAVFNIKLVDFGADGVWGTDDSEHEITLDENTNPAIATSEWISLDVPLSDFSNLTSMEHLAQLIISGDLASIYVDNVYFYDNVTSADANEVNSIFILENNYPNPFNPITYINFTLTKSEKVSLDIYNVKGKKITTLVDANLKPNSYTFNWNGKNNDSKSVSSGVYFYQLKAGLYIETKKMILMK